MPRCLQSKYWKQHNQQLAVTAWNSAFLLKPNIVLYGRETRLQLPFTALTEELKVTKARMAITIQTSLDDYVRKNWSDSSYGYEIGSLRSGR